MPCIDKKKFLNYLKKADEKLGGITGVIRHCRYTHDTLESDKILYKQLEIEVLSGKFENGSDSFNALRTIIEERHKTVTNEKANSKQVNGFLGKLL